MQIKFIRNGGNGNRFNRFSFQKMPIKYALISKIYLNEYID